MRKFCVFLASAVLFLSFFSVNAEAEEYHFYIKRAKGHAAPSTDDRFLPLFGEDAFFLDSKAARENEKRLYLTFDAGYENGNVSKILDVLKEEDVRGTFFVLAHLVKNEEALLSRMKDEGHLICNHTARHKNMARFSKEAFCAELQVLEDLYAEQTGHALAKFYRPPEGTFSASNLACAKEMGYKTVFWSLAYADWNDQVAPPDEKAMQILKDNTHPGAIVLLHPTSSINVRILDEMIRYWKGEGYTFHTLDDII